MPRPRALFLCGDMWALSRETVETKKCKEPYETVVSKRSLVVHGAFSVMLATSPKGQGTREVEVQNLA